VENTIEQIREDALAEIEHASSVEEIRALSIKYVGRKGRISLFLRNISSLPKEQRPSAGQEANVIKQLVEERIKEALQRIEGSDLNSTDYIDVSLPGRVAIPGMLHPISQINQQISNIFKRLGFDIAEGPEIETDYYNFEALNFPKNHPARDMQDTFFVSDDIVLRTHTSPLQIRIMEKKHPPIRVIMPGKVYRCDSDLTHTPMFHQVEGLVVDKNIGFSDLKGVLTTLVHQIFDEEISLRFRPSFFPFTEPSAEVDILCVICRGKGCRVCSQTGWLEVLGSGMVHPAVFENVNYDTSQYSGFAFGMGVERIAMLKYGIDDLRKFFENDFRFLRQF
jgi:phenylalanyl-tRNA synthetase alpha chain